MQNSPNQDPFIRPDQLCVGLFVHLDLSWIRHPFSFSSFKIENQEQIATIRNLGLERIRYTSTKSDCDPAVATIVSNQVIDVEAKVQELQEVILEEGRVCVEKSRRIDRIERLDEKIIACEREYSAALQTLKLMWESITSNPTVAAKQSYDLIDTMAVSEMMESEIAIHLMIDHKNGSDMYTHAMNVAILSMIMAREMGLSDDQIKLIGLGALFHDVGCTDMPRQIKGKIDALTPMEAEALNEHCKHGVDICNKLGLPYESVLIVWQHHERLDGSGYPERLKEKKVSTLASIVAVADAFDEICNPINQKTLHTPHEALSLIYAQQRTQFDGRALTALVHCLGVYPPGTIVLLNNGIIGMVIAVNSKRPLKPTVLVYDPTAATNESVLIDLDQEGGVSVSKTINPNQLSPEVVAFLSGGKRTSYYFRAVPANSRCL